MIEIERKFLVKSLPAEMPGGLTIPATLII
jgi:hypothetical protein